MAQIGSFALLLALALSAYSFLAGLLALLRPGAGSERLGETARRAGIAAFAVVLLAAVVLVIAAFQDDFSIAYIFHHSNRDLPAPYKFATLWSGQEGSLLFWSLLLSAYGLVLRLRHKTDSRLFAHASVIIAAVQVFFLLLLNFAAHPFAIMQGSLPEDGNGLNPLLQYPEMVIHPPMLYLGYVGFTVPFAFALGALIMRYPGEKWIHITRRWTMVTWGLLTCGIFLGAHWAYSVLGWGGYWGWDPVENASFLPWLTGTAFLHSVMMQEKRGMLKVWNMWLVFACFWLAILGTFLTRSGIISSVHAFAQSSIGSWFSWFLGITFAVFVFFFILNHKHPSSWGFIFGLEPWRDVSYFYSLMAIFLSVLVAFTVGSEFYRGGRVIAEKTGQGMFASMVQLTHRNTRRYGGYIVHFGVVLVMIGFSGSALNQDKEAELGYGDHMQIGSYDLVCRSYTQDDNANQETEWALMDVYQNGQLVRTMTPQRIFYKASQQASTKPDIDQGFKEDLYLVYEGQNDKGQPVIKAHLNPMVIWIWIGAWVMIIGTGLALVENAPVPVTVRVPRMMEHAAPVAGD